MDPSIFFRVSLLSFVLVKFHWQGGGSEGRAAFMVNNSRTSSTMATLGTEESGHYADHNMFVVLSSCVLYPIMVIQSEIIYRELML